MIAYVGQTRAAALVGRLRDLGIGEMTVRSEVPPRRFPWAFDNGAFSDFTAGRPFDEPVFVEACNKVRRFVAAGGPRPDFVVVPDIVAGGTASLAFSEAWRERVADLGLLYLAVQDGMEEDDVDAVVGGYAGIFVGGTLTWKRRTSWRWVEYAHRRGLRCHIGRVGTGARANWANRIGADSIDSALPLFSEGNLRAFLGGLRLDPLAQPDLAEA